MSEKNELVESEPEKSPITHEDYLMVRRFLAGRVPEAALDDLTQVVLVNFLRATTVRDRRAEHRRNHLYVLSMRAAEGFFWWPDEKPADFTPEDEEDISTMLRAMTSTLNNINKITDRITNKLNAHYDFLDTIPV